MNHFYTGCLFTSESNTKTLHSDMFYWLILVTCSCPNIYTLHLNIFAHLNLLFLVCIHFSPVTWNKLPLELINMSKKFLKHLFQLQHQSFIYCAFFFFLSYISHLFTFMSALCLAINMLNCITYLFLFVCITENAYIINIFLFFLLFS